MIANFLRTLIFLLLPVFAMGQSLNLSVTSTTSKNSRSTFLLNSGEVTINNGHIQFHETNKTVEGFTDYGISPDRTTIGLLKWSGGKGHIVLLSSKGDTLTTYDTIAMADQTSFGIFPFDNGDILLRDKIANFTFCNTFGDITANMSNSSQSKEGEAVSEVSMSPDGQTVVVYNPKIKQNGTLASKAAVKLADDSFKDIFYSSNRYIKNIEISEDGSMIAIVTAAQGSNDKVFLMDKYGNDISSITTEEETKGVSFAGAGKYITLYSSGRVMVYATRDADRLGSSSFRSSVFLADYFPEDHLILAMTGDYSDPANALGNISVKAINLKKRSITDQEFSGVLGFNKALPVRFIRTSAEHYELIGASKHLKVRANF